MTRAAMNLAGRRWRAFFAPVDRGAGTPAAFDPAAAFTLDSPPAPWIDAGWIENFTRASATELVPLRTGTRQAVTRQARKNLGAQLELDFCDWGKLQMALSGGAQHMNLLAPGETPLEPGSTAAELVVGSTSSFAVGELLAVDVDYAGETGYVGSGISGAYVRAAADVGNDPAYIRRVTFNVARVAAKDTTSLTLAQPLLGGAPASGAKTQRVVGFADREGGSFFQEWSGLFVFENEAGGRVLLYYPRLQPAASAAEAKLELAPPLHALTLHAHLTALPFADALDSEPALCWRTYYPAAGAPLL